MISLVRILFLVLTLLGPGALAAPGDIVNMKEPDGVDEFLLKSAYEGDLDGVKRHLAGGGDINARHQMGMTPLLVAVHGGRTAVCHHLLEQGADPNIRDDNGIPLLFHALHFNNNEILLDLLQHGADPDMTSHRLSTPLMQAAAEGKEEAVKLLLSFEADCTIRDINGNVAMYYALVNAQEDISRLLTLCTPQEMMP